MSWWVMFARLEVRLGAQGCQELQGWGLEAEEAGKAENYSVKGVEDWGWKGRILHRSQNTMTRFERLISAERVFFCTFAACKP